MAIVNALRTARRVRTGQSLRVLFILIGVCLGTAPSYGAEDPGDTAIAEQHGASFEIRTDAIGVTWQVKDGKLTGVVVTDRLHQRKLEIEAPFAIELKDGVRYDARNLVVSGPPTQTRVRREAKASRLADRIDGQQFDLPLETQDHSLRAVWSVTLRDGASYLRQTLTVTAVDRDIPIKRITLIDLALNDALVRGSVTGSPIVAGDWFLGLENPLSQSDAKDGHAAAWVDRNLPLRAGQSITYSAVIGVAHNGQMRRDFLAYLERERAHPYRTFLHYNSWYDLGYFTPYDEKEALERVRSFGLELAKKRNVKIDSFLFDDGWDNHQSLWKFNRGFPEGFENVKTAAEQFGAEPGVWMSPWGGYSKPKEERIAYGRTAGYEIVADGYALSGPKYYAAFRDVCRNMMQQYGVNQFKFDGTGNANTVFPGSRFDSDFAAAIHLIGELRAMKPDVYVNLTTGTWPSPFWLLDVDSIWRGGEDDSTAGEGTYRERWITYRDAETYHNIVKRAPLFPLNSLMLHGMIYAQYHKELNRDPGDDFRNEIRSYFGTGTQLQEMYITPSLLSEKNWDDLAEAANWSRANADVLRDTHWTGGDPAKLEVYGWAAWSPRKGILVLRNPSGQQKSISIKLQDVFELPAGAAQSYIARSPWKSDAEKAPIRLSARQPKDILLQPFEVLTLDVTPGR